MALTLSDLQAQRDAALKQLSQPSQVAFRDRSQSNRSAADLRAAIERLDAEIAAINATSSGVRRVRQVRISTRSGF